MARAADAVRRGDLAGARAAAEAAVAAQPGDPAAREMLGDVLCRTGRAGEGAVHLRAALEAAPGREDLRMKLASALLMVGDLAGAEGVCAASAAPGSADLLRMHGYALHGLGRAQEAAEVYRRLVTLVPQDAEGWNNLGNALRDAGDAAGAVAALQKARGLRPDMPPITFNLGIALAAAGDLEPARETLHAAATAMPGDAGPLLELSRVLNRLDRSREAMNALDRALAIDPRRAELHVQTGVTAALLGDRVRAGEAFRAALALEPGDADAVARYGNFLESENRLSDLAALLDNAAANGIPDAPLMLLRAQLLRREGKLEEALALAEAAPDEEDPVRKAQVIGEIADRMGDSARAFASFGAMNDRLAAEPSDPRAGARIYRDEVAAVAALTTSDWYAGWTPPAPPSVRPAPVFLVGFPRSGTTLLDTVLMGHPHLHVLEEQPVLHPVTAALGGDEKLATLPAGEIAHLRSLYFAEVDRIAPEAAGMLLIDKMPLNIRQAPLLHRLFPEARWLFAERHPCDVVLSCYMTNFRLNYAMANFLDLGDAAALYDAVLGYWEQAKAVFALDQRPVRYEALVADMEAEVRPLFDFLGLGWDDAVLDHQRTAEGRGYIRSASYAQVTEPIYRRAAGRWERYRDQLAPVLPLLEPWARRMGYPL
ncbi:tetratricopeptide repeat-containing sulfotransferase family protein [Allosphingosinicella indica]|uniref:Flp pilus assembly protein TadD, contains TPR repeats n=1 Tax=Allosphingosinicella indica TaxID=941907 RepID=A0A1X7GM86_9SPHN|nr:tetratricopeptide repeat-containing sulfotransferase family protein [Allosphingosinicella indica]SMF71171.1 Flp pilus assembly protein TadD, contains TPR repeats [Allosphingosinicella indica]